MDRWRKTAWFKSQPCHLQAVQLGGSVLPSLAPTFLICEIDTVVSSTSHGHWESYTYERLESVPCGEHARSEYAAVFNRKARFEELKNLALPFIQKSGSQDSYSSLVCL